MLKRILLSLVFTIIVTVFILLPFDNIKAAGGGDPYSCLYIGGPDYECEYSYWENCFCESVPIYG